ncbi:hypothetical protein L286_16795 [Sphingobium sp. HDIP04]|jgi:hypothetical protein|nr:hypothetical protein L286_16795 [Sphingobium sp. HDIP04]
MEMARQECLLVASGKFIDEIDEASIEIAFSKKTRSLDRT